MLAANVTLFSILSWSPFTGANRIFFSGRFTTRHWLAQQLVCYGRRMNQAPAEARHAFDALRTVWFKIRSPISLTLPLLLLILTTAYNRVISPMHSSLEALLRQALLQHSFTRPLWFCWLWLSLPLACAHMLLTVMVVDIKAVRRRKKWWCVINSKFDLCSCFFSPWRFPKFLYLVWLLMLLP